MDIRKAVLIFTGTVCVGLGVLGIFLPLMPTTVFLLMAAYCYSKSSDRFHTWLLNNRWLGSYIKTYKSGQGISVRQKATSIAILWASIGFSIWMINGKLWVTLLLAAIAIAITIHLLWIKTYRPGQSDEADEPQQPDPVRAAAEL
ncbi:MAG: YbaN family protein [Acidobacteria bacterium]|nr:YbaN family protein [Acidobacteriota bacterium]MCW5950091.1 YbaN family protein [Pyrinomonadaceae bacterium]